MDTIWKYSLPVEDEFVLRLPRGWKPLSVQTQGNGPQLWCLVDASELRSDSVRFRCIGTGHPIAGVDLLSYVGTAQVHGGALVWHYFRVLEVHFRVLEVHL